MHWFCPILFIALSIHEITKRYLLLFVSFFLLLFFRDSQVVIKCLQTVVFRHFLQIETFSINQSKSWLVHRLLDPVEHVIPVHRQVKVHHLPNAQNHQVQVIMAVDQIKLDSTRRFVWKNINPKNIRFRYEGILFIPRHCFRLFIEIRDLCTKKILEIMEQISVKIYHRHLERVSICGILLIVKMHEKLDMLKTGLIWEKTQVLLETVMIFSSHYFFIDQLGVLLFLRVYYRKTVSSWTTNQTVPSSSWNVLHHLDVSVGPLTPSPSPPPVSSRGRAHHQSSSRHHRTTSPPRSARPPRRPYSPYIPLPPDLLDYATKKF